MEQVEEYLKRSITDIARKCHTTNEIVIKTIKKLINK